MVVLGNVDIDKALTSTGSAYLVGDVEVVTGDMTVTNSIQSQVMLIDGAQITTGKSSAYDGMHVVGASELDGNVTTTGTLRIDGDLVIGGSHSGGGAQAGHLVVDNKVVTGGAHDVVGTLTVNGPMTVTGSATATGLTTAAVVKATGSNTTGGDHTVSGDLVVTGGAKAGTAVGDHFGWRMNDVTSSKLASGIGYTGVNNALDPSIGSVRNVSSGETVSKVPTKFSSILALSSTVLGSESFDKTVWGVTGTQSEPARYWGSTSCDGRYLYVSLAAGSAPPGTGGEPSEINSFILRGDSSANMEEPCSWCAMKFSDISTGLEKSYYKFVSSDSAVYGFPTGWTLKALKCGYGKPFDEVSSWEVANLATIAGATDAYNAVTSGAVVLGGYLYTALTWYTSRTDTTPQSVLLRHDLSGDFDNSATWSKVSLHTQTISGYAMTNTEVHKIFTDGERLYLSVIPGKNSSSTGSFTMPVVCYNPITVLGGSGDPLSNISVQYSCLDLVNVIGELIPAAPVNKNFKWASGLYQTDDSWTGWNDTTGPYPNFGTVAPVTFDGRFVYFGPTNNWMFGDNFAGQGPGGLWDVSNSYVNAFFRYDTFADFSSSAAWDWILYTYKSDDSYPQLKCFYDGVFDGRHVAFAGNNALWYDTYKSFRGGIIFLNNPPTAAGWADDSNEKKPNGLEYISTSDSVGMQNVCYDGDRIFAVNGLATEHAGGMISDARVAIGICSVGTAASAEEPAIRTDLCGNLVLEGGWKGSHLVLVSDDGLQIGHLWVDNEGALRFGTGSNGPSGDKVGDSLAS